MKRFFIALAVIIFTATNMAQAAPVSNAKTNSAIRMYKNKNYTECLQVMHEVVSDDPSNVLAYYYIAISQARLGEKTKAQEAYQRVIDLNTSTQLSNYAKNGLECLEDSNKCKTEFNMDPTRKAIDAVNKQMEERKIDTVKDIINSKQNIQEVPIEYMKEFKDYSLPKNQLQNKSEIPTQEEIANALDVLKRAGYQNYMPQPAMTQEMMQLSMLNSMNGTTPNSMNPMANFMPYMMTGQNTSQMDPQFLQTMMMSSMMNGMYNDYQR